MSEKRDPNTRERIATRARRVLGSVTVAHAVTASLAFGAGAVTIEVLEPRVTAVQAGETGADSKPSLPIQPETQLQTDQEKRLTDDLRAGRSVQYVRGILAVVGGDGATQLVQNPVVLPRGQASSGETNLLEEYDFYAVGNPDNGESYTSLTAYQTSPDTGRPESRAFYPTPNVDELVAWTNSGTHVFLADGASMAANIRDDVVGNGLDGIELYGQAYEPSHGTAPLLQESESGVTVHVVGFAVVAR